MSDTYTKLFSSITESTIWSEPAGTRLVWITFLAKCNKRGEVFGSLPGMARLSNVTLEECETAIATLLAPDKWSRTPDNEGRRIEVIDGGWRILNHAKFDNVRNADERSEYKRRWDRENRGSRPNASHRTPDKPPTAPDATPANPTPPTPTLEKKEAKALERLAARFDEFWQAYPVRKGKADALAKWKARRLDAIADRIIEDVMRRKAEDRQWLAGYAPHASTYVNGKGWEDEIESVQRRQSAQDEQPDFMRGAI